MDFYKVVMDSSQVAMDSLQVEMNLQKTIIHEGKRKRKKNNEQRIKIEKKLKKVMNKKKIEI